MKDSLIVVDGEIYISVNAEKALLVREVIKHYVQRWKQEIADGKIPNVRHGIATILHKLCIDYTFIERIEHVNVLTSSSEAAAQAGNEDAQLAPMENDTAG